MPTPQSAKLRRKRCLNCNKYFVPRPNVGRRARFCKKECCDEFHRHGSAFGPMKQGLYKAIDKKYAALEKTTGAKMRGLVDQITRAVGALVNRRLSELDQRITYLENLEAYAERLKLANVERIPSNARSQ